MTRARGPAVLARLITCDDRTQPPTPGTPRKEHTITVEERILDSIERLGMTPSLAAREAGIDPSTITRYIKEARASHNLTATGRRLPAGDQRVLNFVIRCDQARARYLAGQMQLHEAIAQGGLTTAEVVEEVDPTQLVVGNDGVERPKLLKRKVKTVRLLPDAGALRWNIERKSRAIIEGGVELTPDEGLGNRRELTGADGTPLDGPRSREEREEALLAEAKAFVMGAAAQRQLSEEEAAEPVRNDAGG